MKRRRNKIIAVLLLLAMCAGTLGAAVPAPQAAAQSTVPIQRVGEVISLRETNSETYLLSDGSYECVVYPGNKYYRDERNTLKLIDNTLILHEASTKTDQRNYTNTANAFQVTFSDSRTPTVTMEKGSQSIRFQAESASGSNQLGSATANQTVTVGAVRNCAPLTQLADTGDNTITYANVFHDTNLVYVLENSAVKEYIVLNSPQAPNTFTFRFTLENLTLKADDGIGVFLDEQHNEVFRLDRLFAMDANEETTDALSYTFASIKGSRDILVTVTLDKTFLTDDDRAFPIVIDPSVTVTSSKTADASVYSANPNTNYKMDNRLRTGKSSTYGVSRTYIKFDLPQSIYGNYVTTAYLDLKKHSGSTPTTRAYSCASSWTSGGIKWNNKPDPNLPYESTMSTPRSDGNGWYRMNVAFSVHSWAYGTTENYGFVVIDETENDTSHNTTFYSSDASSSKWPELYIHYVVEDDDSDVDRPRFNLAIMYDHGYIDMYNGASQRINAIGNMIADFYTHEFSLDVYISNPLIISSLADTCSLDITQACTHEGTSDCQNSYQLNSVPYKQTIHHKNLYNILYDITIPSGFNASILFTGHQTCFESDLFGCIENGIYKTIYGLCEEVFDFSVVIPRETTEKEAVSAIHEIGHLFFTLDHDADVVCLYSEDVLDMSTPDDIVLCPSCRNTINEHKNKYS